MTKRIVCTETTYKPIHDTSATYPRMDAAQVAKALGADPVAAELSKALPPLTLFAVREELFRRLQSSGGRPGLSGASVRAKIPVSEEEWLELEALAAKLSTTGCAPTAGQVASVILKLSLTSLSTQSVGSE